MRSNRGRASFSSAAHSLAANGEPTPVARATREKDRAAVLRTVALFVGFLIGGVSGRLAYLTVSAFAPALFALTPLVLAAAMRRAHPDFRLPADDA